MLQETDDTDLEWCPSCGDGVHKLNSVTGFCAKCTYRTTGRKECERCDRIFVPDQNSRTLCSVCVQELWLIKNADAIEEVMATRNTTVVEAIIVVKDDNRPRCALCNTVMPHRSRQTTKFCHKKDACRRAAIRYQRYRKRNGMSDDDALRKAIGTANGNKGATDS